MYLPGRRKGWPQHTGGIRTWSLQFERSMYWEDWSKLHTCKAKPFTWSLQFTGQLVVVDNGTGTRSIPPLFALSLSISLSLSLFLAKEEAKCGDSRVITGNWREEGMSTPQDGDRQNLVPIGNGQANWSLI